MHHLFEEYGIVCPGATQFASVGLQTEVPEGQETDPMAGVAKPAVGVGHATQVSWLSW